MLAEQFLTVKELEIETKQVRKLKLGTSLVYERKDQTMVIKLKLEQKEKVLSRLTQDEIGFISSVIKEEKLKFKLWDLNNALK